MNPKPLWDWTIKTQVCSACSSILYAPTVECELILITIILIFLTIWVVTWKVPTPNKLKCACMYASPSVRLTHLTKLLPVCERTAEDATETDWCHRAPRCARNKWKQSQAVNSLQGGCGAMRWGMLVWRRMCGCVRGWLVGGRLWLVHCGACRLDRFLIELFYCQEFVPYEKQSSS